MRGELGGTGCLMTLVDMRGRTFYITRKGPQSVSLLSVPCKEGRTRDCGSQRGVVQYSRSWDLHTLSSEKVQSSIPSSHTERY